MTRATWDSCLETGHSDIDAQHRHLFELFNALQDAADSGDPGPSVDDVLDELSAYVMVHFEAERQLMAETAFDRTATADHLAEHDQLTNRVRDMVLEYRRGELTSVAPLIEFMQGWLSDHIRQTDRRLVDHVRTMPESDS